MPRFYIHFRNGDLLANDDEGQDLPSFEEAEAAAVVAGRQILADNVKFNAANPLTAIIITNENGDQLATIPHILPRAFEVGPPQLRSILT